MGVRLTDASDERGLGQGEVGQMMTRRAFLATAAAGVLVGLDACGGPSLRRAGSAGSAPSLRYTPPPGPTLDGTRYGLVGDGRTDNQASLQALVDRVAATGGGTIYVPGGTYLKSKGTVWRSKVSIVGAGPDKTVFKLDNRSSRGTCPFAVYLARQGASVSRPLADCTFDNLAIDGSDVVFDQYQNGYKGFALQYSLRVQLHRVVVQDTVASGFGCDFMRDSLISDCRAVNCGRGNDGTQPGGAGIGIGVGGYLDAEGGSWDEAPLLVEDCVTTGNGTHGLFFESQSLQAAHVRTRGIWVRRHTATGNGWGISDWGCDGLVVESSRAEGNRLDGFNVGYGVAGYPVGGRSGTIRGCTLDGNGRSGFRISSDTPPGGYTLERSTLSNEGGEGLSIVEGRHGARSPLSEMRIASCIVTGNAGSGIGVHTRTDKMTIEHNVIRDNGTDLRLAVRARSGVLVSAVATDAMIRDNDFVASARTATQTYAVCLEKTAIAPGGATLAGNETAGQLETPPVMSDVAPAPRKR